ncbi:hypothetical protein ACLOJK_022542 [Asimina triloba]
MPISLKIMIISLPMMLFLEAHIFCCLAATDHNQPSAWRGHEMDVGVKRGSVSMWGEEMEMDSEINRRILAVQKRYISYGSLRKDAVPCSRPGASYYNCRQMEGHPYARGCSVITACRENVP